MSGPNWTLSDDRKTVTVTFPTTPPVAFQLDVDAVEDMLKNLGMFRAGMTPEVPKTFAQAQKVSAVLDPGWVTEPDAMMGDSLLHIRDPHFGWLHYLLPKAEAQKLAHLLENQAAAPRPGLGPGKAN
jgi:hypothetical protein